MLRTLGKYQMIYQSIGFLDIYYKYWILCQNVRIISEYFSTMVVIRSIKFIYFYLATVPILNNSLQHAGIWTIAAVKSKISKEMGCCHFSALQERGT